MLSSAAYLLLCALAALLIVAGGVSVGFFDGGCRVRAGEAVSPAAWITAAGC